MELECEECQRSFDGCEHMAVESNDSAATREIARLRADLERVTGERKDADDNAAEWKRLCAAAVSQRDKAEAQRDAARGDLSALIGMTPPDQGMLTAWLCPECWYLDDRPPKEDKCHPKPGTTLAVCDVTMHRIAWAAAGAKMLKQLKAARAVLAASKPEGGAE